MKRHALHIETRYKTACVTQVRKNSSLKVVRESGHKLGQPGGDFKNKYNNIQGQTQKLVWHILYYCVVNRQWSN